MTRRGAIAQLGERLLCKQEVTGSIPVGSTNFEHLTTCNPKIFCVTHAARMLFNNLKVFLF
jgi:hypothetical protein